MLETAQGYVLIDHKSSPHAESQWDELVAEYKPQLDAYAKGIVEASGRSVMEQWLLLPVSAAMVKI